MKIALYHPWIYLHGGLERTILELVGRSRHDWTIFTGFYDRDGAFPEFAAHDVRVLKPTNIDRSIVNVLRSAVQVASQKLPLDPDTDAVMVMCDGIGDLITVRNTSLPLFNLCFTPLRAAFDPSYEASATSTLSAYQRALYFLFKHSFRAVDRLAWKRYRNVITISDEVERRILAGRLCTTDRMIRANPGIDMPESLTGLAYEPFILITGRIMWTKNLQLAIKAFLAAGLPPPWRLVIAGFVDKKSESYLEELRALAGDGAVEFVLRPTDEEMADLNHRAAFCLFTPLNEDWGIVPLEAMARAKLVIANDAGGPREMISHGRSGYLLPPVVEDWAASIAKLAADRDLVETMGRQAYVDVQRFTWKHFVDVIDDALDVWMAPERIPAAAQSPAPPVPAYAPSGRRS